MDLPGLLIIRIGDDRMPHAMPMRSCFVLALLGHFSLPFAASGEVASSLLSFDHRTQYSFCSVLVPCSLSFGLVALTPYWSVFHAFSKAFSFGKAVRAARHAAPEPAGPAGPRERSRVVPRRLIGTSRERREPRARTAAGASCGSGVTTNEGDATSPELVVRSWLALPF